MNKFHPVTLSVNLIRHHKFNWLGQRAMIIYIHLRSWHTEENPKITFTFEELRETTGIGSTKFIQTALTTLQLAGFIKIELLTDVSCTCYLVKKWL